MSLIIAVALSTLLTACSTSNNSKPSKSTVQLHATSNTKVDAAFPVLPVSHVGRWLVDASGRVLLLHGVNVV
ncbi:MAG: hypothetical protein M1456_05625, partial [Actinobacteria bacterium]|nr:hypothetical protein [Actinomycetota bacterium]